MRLLVTGATGFIGRPLVKRMIARGTEVFGLALEEDIANFGRSDGKRPGLTLLPADLRDIASTAAVVAQVRPDRIIHLAAAGVTNPTIESRLALQHNVHGTLNLIHAAFQNRDLTTPPRQLITIRTPGESHPANAYTASKAAAWSFCQMYATRQSWPIVGAMIFQAYGPEQAPHTFIQAALRSALASEDFAMSSGRQERDWIYLDDVVDGLIAALGAELQPGSSFDLGTGRLSSLIEVADHVYELVGRGGRPQPGGLPDRSGESFKRAANIGRSTELLSWVPQIELADGLKLVLASLT